MSQLTDFGENRLADMIRAQTWTLGASLYLALASAATDASVTELSGTGYARFGLTRALASWAGTQAAGSTSASSGTSHATSNNVAINFGTSGAAWGTANFIVVYDAATAGNAICYLPLSTPIVIGASQPVSIGAGVLNFTLGLTGGCSDYLCNALLDFIFRGVAFTFPATMYEALLTAAPANAGGGTEVGGGVGYARVAIVGSLTSWLSTQGVSGVASTGTAGLISNTAAIAFPPPTGAGWGIVGWCAEYDAASAGNLLFWSPLNATKSVPGRVTAPAFQAAGRTITFA